MKKTYLFNLLRECARINLYKITFNKSTYTLTWLQCRLNRYILIKRNEFVRMQFDTKGS